jgi:hypothetical protein
MFGVSLVIAGVAWAAYAPELAPVQKSFTVPLEFGNVPPGYVVQDVVPRETVVTLEGRSSDFDSLPPESLDVSLDLSSIKGAGWQTIPVTPRNVEAPTNFSVIQVGSASIQVDVVAAPQK